MNKYYEHNGITIYHGNSLEVLKEMDSESVQCCVTSPPYWGLRAYLPDGVVMKKDTPLWVKEELLKRGIFPIDNTEG